MRILCFGDSNTYGYDPRVYLGGRYDKANRWPDILGQLTGCEVFNDSMNGRAIPRHSMELKLFDGTLERVAPDMMIVMLGTNDVVTGASAAETRARMAAFLDRIPKGIKLMIIAPHPVIKGVWVEDEHIIEESWQLADEYRALAKERSILFEDGVDLPISHDGVHLSEEGHHVLAGMLSAAVKTLL